VFRAYAQGIAYPLVLDDLAAHTSLADNRAMTPRLVAALVLAATVFGCSGDEKCPEIVTVTNSNTGDTRYCIDDVSTPLDGPDVGTAD
jgi:hypothetical protein